MNFDDDYVLYDEELSQSGPSYASSSFCPDHGQSRWDCGCPGVIYTPDTSPLVTQEHFRQPYSYPTTEVSQDLGYEGEFLEPAMFAEADEPELDPALSSPSAHEPVAVSFTPYDPSHGVTPTARHQRIEQVIGAVPPVLENPEFVNGNLYRQAAEALRSTTPTTSPPGYFAGIGTHFYADADNGTVTELACPQCSRTCRAERELKRHMRWHDDKKRHKCEFCDYTYLKPTDYVRHRKTHMPKAQKKSQSLPCRFPCGTTITRKDNIWRHLHKKHGMTKAEARQFVRTHY